MTADDILRLPVVQEFDGVAKRVLSDLQAIPSITDNDSLSQHEAMIRNEIQALQVAATKLSRAAYQVVSERRAAILKSNVDQALDRVKEVLGEVK